MPLWSRPLIFVRLLLEVQLQHEAIHAACEAVGYTAWRDRLLNPVITVQLFLFQILHGNTACRHLPHLAGFYFRASAYLSLSRFMIECASISTIP